MDNSDLLLVDRLIQRGVMSWDLVGSPNSIGDCKLNDDGALTPVNNFYREICTTNGHSLIMLKSRIDSQVEGEISMLGISE